MQVRRIILACAALSGFCLASAKEQAEEAKTTTPTNAPSRLEVKITSEGGPGQIASSRAYLSSGTNQVAFLVPNGFGLDDADPQKVTLTQPGCCTITVRIVGPVP